MADIELVIKIPEEMYAEIIDENGINTMLIPFSDIIRDGRPLPDGTEILTKEAYSDLCRRAAEQPEKRTEERTKTHACVCISRQTAIDAIRNLPSAQPEIIRCNQCKYAEVADPEDCQDGYTCQYHRGSIWFSGSYCSWAERRTKNDS